MREYFVWTGISLTVLALPLVFFYGDQYLYMTAVGLIFTAIGNLVE